MPNLRRPVIIEVKVLLLIKIAVDPAIKVHRHKQGIKASKIARLITLMPKKRALTILRRVLLRLKADAVPAKEIIVPKVVHPDPILLPEKDINPIGLDIIGKVDDLAPDSIA